MLSSEEPQVTGRRRSLARRAVAFTALVVVLSLSNSADAAPDKAPQVKARYFHGPGHCGEPLSEPNPST